MKIVILNGTVIDPANNTNTPRDVLIEDGIVRAVEKPGMFRKTDAEVIDASSLIVAPGFVDIHVHLREPGQEYKETLLTGTQSAVAGGFTSVACMANTNPVNDNGAVTRYIVERAREANLARVFPIGALSKGLKGEELASLGEMVDSGAVAISDDGRPVMNANLMRRALEYCSMLNVPISVHEEDLHLAGGGVMNEGPTALRLGLRGIPNAAEDVMIARDITLARLTGGRVHIAHLSTRGAVALVRQAKAEGLPLTVETCPHYLTFASEDVPDGATQFKCCPPVRERENREKLWEAVADGIIDMIVSDHSPCTPALKMQQQEFKIQGVVETQA